MKTFLNLVVSMPPTMKIEDALMSAFVLARENSVSVELFWDMGITYKVYPDFTGLEINTMIDKAVKTEKLRDDARAGKTVKKSDLHELKEGKIQLDTLALSELLIEAADSLHAGHTQGMRTILIREDITLRDFMRFCLGRDVIGIEEEKPT